jgi:light-regulated signal transduction histidine kinase (bacteriophytochrome)/CheY-like chemotaxis protein
MSKNISVEASSGTLRQEVDLTSCDREPIHVLGRVQSFGALVAVSSDWIVAHASHNVEEYLGIVHDELIGCPLAEAMSADALHEIRGKMATLSGVDAVARIFGLKVRPDRAPVNVAVHLSGRAIVLEFEKHEGGRQDDYSSFVRPMIERIGKAENVEDLCQAAAKQLRALTGFDRVMVYQFGADGTGSVIAEHHKPCMEPFLGLRYPASDIPKQARELYRRSLLRIISDVDDAGHAIEPVRNPEGESLDLSSSTTRAVSPIHLEYLRNMGVGASMSVSILKRGELWGLFACHHERPKTLPYEVRTAAELFGQLFAFVLDQKESDQEREDMVKAQLLHDQLMAQLADGSSIADNIETITNAISTVIEFDGAAAWIDGQFTAQGLVPTKEQFLGLVRFLNTTAASRVYHTEALTKVFPAAEDYAERCAGMLVLPVSRTPRDYIVLFRKEVARTVTWAGNPEKPAELGPNGIRLTPRKSFEAWQQVVQNTAKPWASAEVRAAEALRMTLLEVLLRVSDAAVRDRAKAQEQQELLIAELNHRVRNILNLIKGLVNQSKSEAKTVSEFTEVVGGRIHALARAHDQITKEQWTPASAYKLLRTEAEAYSNQNANRLQIEGPDICLQPAAFTTMSLVFHELLTNASKYGALTDERGEVTVCFNPYKDGTVEIVWQEKGGPPIGAPPKRRGFGTTVIERSVPYELKGEADIVFETTGLRARFMLPAAHVAEVLDKEEADAPQTSTNKNSQLGLSGDVLIVEDNMIIALDAEQFMAELGAERVHVASNVPDALDVMKKRELTFALLDVNLGTNTSEDVAKRLKEASIPFVFATGYGDSTGLTKRFSDTPVLQKPYDKTHILAALSESL